MRVREDGKSLQKYGSLATNEARLLANDIYYYFIVN